MNLLVYVATIITLISAILALTSLAAFIVILILWTCANVNAKLKRVDKKKRKPKNKYGKSLLITLFVMITSLVIQLIATHFVAIGGRLEGVFYQSEEFYNFNHNIGEQNWVISVDEANGFIGRNFRLTQEELDNITTTIQLSEGDIYIGLLQLSNDTSEFFIISEQITTKINTENFEPGVIRKFVNFRDATDVDLIISWTSNDYDE